MKEIKQSKVNSRKVVIIDGHRYFERAYVPGFPRMKELIRCKDRLKSSKKQSLKFKLNKVSNPQKPDKEINNNLERVSKHLERSGVPLIDPNTFHSQKSLDPKSLLHEPQFNTLSIPLPNENIVFSKKLNVMDILLNK